VGKKANIFKAPTGTETADVEAAGISVKVTRLTLGDLSFCRCATDTERWWDGMTEVSPGRRNCCICSGEGPNMSKRK